MLEVALIVGVFLCRIYFEYLLLFDYEWIILPLNLHDSAGADSVCSTDAWICK